MAANTATLMPDFPISIGNRFLSVITLTGPSSYTAISIGTPPTGGQTLTASQFGLKFLEIVLVAMSSDGQYTGMWTATKSDKNGVTAGILTWNYAVNGAEVSSGDLSGATLRVTAIGR